MMPVLRVDEILKLDNQLCFPLYAASRLIVQSYEHVLTQFRLTYPQYLVLLVLWENEGLSVKEIGAKLWLDSGTLTPVLKKLESLELVERRRSKEDDRFVHNFLTNKGRKLKPKVADMSFDLFCRSGLQPEEVEALRTTLRAVSKKLSNLRHLQVSGLAV